MEMAKSSITLQVKVQFFTRNALSFSDKFTSSFFMRMSSYNSLFIWCLLCLEHSISITSFLFICSISLGDCHFWEMSFQLFLLMQSSYFLWLFLVSSSYLSSPSQALIITSMKSTRKMNPKIIAIPWYLAWLL